MHRTATAALVILVGGLAAGGCGGKDSKPLTVSGFVQQVEAVCTRLNTQNLAAVQLATRAHPGGGLSTEARAQVLAKAKANQQRALTQLRALEPPDRLRLRYTQWQGALHASFVMGPGEGTTESEEHHAQRKALAEKLYKLETGLDVKACL